MTCSLRITGGPQTAARTLVRKGRRRVENYLARMEGFRDGRSNAHVLMSTLRFSQPSGPVYTKNPSFGDRFQFYPIQRP